MIFYIFSNFPKALYIFLILSIFNSFGMKRDFSEISEINSQIEFHEPEAKRQKIEGMLNLLRSYPDTNINLFSAISLDDPILIGSLIIKGDDIADLNEDGLNAIEDALVKGKSLAAEFLITYVSKNTDLSKHFFKGFDEDTNNLIHFAANKHKGAPNCVSKKVLELLIANGVDINLKNDDDKTPLVFAIAVGNLTFARYLIECGANPNLSNYFGPNVLYVAFFYNEMTKDFLEYIFKLNIKLDHKVKSSKEFFYGSILHLAIENATGSHSVENCLMKLEFLRDNNLLKDVINHQNISDETPLHYSLRNTKSEKIALFLIKNGADLSIRGGANNLQPLTFALSKGKSESAKAIFVRLQKESPEILNEDIQDINDLAIENNQKLDLISGIFSTPIIKQGLINLIFINKLISRVVISCYIRSLDSQLREKKDRFF